MIHVFPTNDLRPHLLVEARCDCSPKVLISTETGELIVVHSSYDGREGVEAVNEILSKPIDDTFMGDNNKEV